MEGEHRIEWCNPDPRHDTINIVCSCETVFRDSHRSPAQHLWEIHRDSFQGKPYAPEGSTDVAS